MNKLVVFIFLLMPFLINAQKKGKPLANKTFMINIGFICEETPDGNPCAGVDIYLVLHFTKMMVYAIEKEVSTCGEQTTLPIGEFMWKWEEGNKSTIEFNPKEVEGTPLENLTLQYYSGELVGEKLNENNSISKYLFYENPN